MKDKLKELVSRLDMELIKEYDKSLLAWLENKRRSKKGKMKDKGIDEITG